MLRRFIADLMFAQGRSGLAAWLDPGRAEFLSAAALAARDAGRPARARRYAERALRVDPTLDAMHRLLSSLSLSGEHYLAVLERIHEHLQPRTYVEIGVFRGKSMQLVRPGTRALGVDPAPSLDAPLPANVRLFTETSDDFFARRDVRAELGGLPVDLAFIDGMHHFEFALRDFINLERLCTKDSTILLHDCFPCHESVARRERVTTFWTGDIWRVVVLLKKYRPDLAIHTIAAPPSGLCLVRNLDPDSRVLAANLERLCAEFMALDFRYLESDAARKLALHPNDWNRIRELLPK